jgi:hypothetical protein
MTAYTPVYRIKVDGSVVTSATLSGLTITSGRTDIYSQPVAGYCNLSLIETTLSQVSYEINDSVTVEVKNSAGVYVYLFGGFITDLSIAVSTSSTNVITQRINIVAVGALARLARAIYTGNLSSGNDGTQIATVLSTVLFDSWNEVPAATQWTTYDPTVQWQNAQNSGYGEIDVPGDYPLDSQNNLNDTVYNIASKLATSGLGYIYEDAQGRVGYADSTHRSQYLSTNGYIDLDANHGIGPNLEIKKKAGDVRNAITISYGSSGNSTVSATSLASISLYGQLASTISTTLKNSTDAQAQADYYLNIRAYPQYALQRISFPLANSEIDDADRDALLNVFIGLPLNISNLPSNMGGGEFQGFVEGWTWTANMNSLSLSMVVSPVAYSLQAFRWNSVPAVEKWNTLNPDLTWLNATIVA